MRRTALVLQGGAALGAYEQGVLERLAEEPAFRPEVISGTSIGAVNGALYLAGDLQAFWAEVALPTLPALAPYAMMFGHPSLYAPRFDYPLMPWWTSVYHHEPLRRSLERHVDFDRLNAHPVRLLVTAANVLTGRIRVFDSHRERIGVEHLMATSSLPPGLPATEVDGVPYWDGGLAHSTPLASVLNTLPDGPAQVVVVDPHPPEAPRPGTLSEVLERLLGITTASMLRSDIRRAQVDNDLAELDRELPPDSPIRHTAVYRRLQSRSRFVDLVHLQAGGTDTGGFDFSAETLRRRRESGLRDADLALAEGRLDLRERAQGVSAQP